MKLYLHYKNKPYKYIGLVRHSETQQELALYECRYENPSGKLWVRPKDMFFENIELDGVSVPRFKQIPLQVKEVFVPSAEQIKDIYDLSVKVFGSADLTKTTEKLNKPGFFGLLAYIDQKLVGMKLGWAQTPEIFYSWLGGVHPDYRDVGIAQDLMQIQEQWCSKQGIRKIQTKTTNQFRQMLGLLLRAGFLIHSCQVGPSNQTEILLEKSLSQLAEN